MQIDFRSHVLRFLDKPPLEYKAGTYRSTDGGIRIVSRMTGTIQSMFGNTMMLPVSDEVAINGNKASSLLNTGLVMPVTAQTGAAKMSAPAKGIGSGHDQGRAGRV